MARQPNMNDLAGIALIHSKVSISEDPIFISYYGKEEWNATFKFDPSLLEDYVEKLEDSSHGSNIFSDYVNRIQFYSTPFYINKDFDVYPKGLYVDLAVCAKMQSHLVVIDLDGPEDELDPHGIGLLVMLSVTSTNGFSIPKELLNRFSKEFLKTCLMVAMADCKNRYYRHSTKRKLREIRNKMREFMGISAEMMNNKYTK